MYRCEEDGLNNAIVKHLQQSETKDHKEFMADE